MAVIKGNSSNNNLFGTLNNDSIYGYAGSDTLLGRAGNDLLNGGDGNDTLNGESGIDTLKGGKGNDTYIVNSTTDKITELGGGGIDTVKSSVSYTLGSYLNNLTLTGNSAIKGTGNEYNNTITGNSANNILNGGTGNDTLKGGKGNDTYIVDGTTDKITELSSSGSDTVKSSVSYTLGAYLNNLTLTGSSAINGTGNIDNNVITGNSASNILNGGTGDTLHGDDGDDSLNAYQSTAYGDDGDDRLEGYYSSLYGGIGNDTLFIDADGVAYGDDGDDRLEGFFQLSGGDITLYGGNGNDTLFGDQSVMYGNDGDDVIEGSNAEMNGGRGNDTLSGGVYFVFDHPSEGVDTLTNFSSGSEAQILVSAGGFGGGLTPNAPITPEQFRLGSSAGDASDRFIYNQRTGDLFFDADGNSTGGAGQIKFAMLTGLPSLTNNDILTFA